MSLTQKDEALNHEWTETRTVSRKARTITPAELYDRLSKTVTNVALLKMGDAWVLGRMLPLAEIGDDAVVRRLGGTYGIEVIHQAATWEAMVAAALEMKW